MQYESECVHIYNSEQIRLLQKQQQKGKLLITTLLMKVAAYMYRMFTARAHVRDCPVQSRSARTFAHESTANVYRLAIKRPDMLMCRSQGPKR